MGLVTSGLVRDLNPGSPAPEARIIPVDLRAMENCRMGTDLNFIRYVEGIK